MEFVLDSVLNLVGFLVGLSIGIMSTIGYRNTGSPTLFRLSIAFFAISIGFFTIWIGFVIQDIIIKTGYLNWVQSLGIGIQTIGYFFIAFSHSIKAFLPKSRYFRSVAIFPIFIVSTVHIEHIFRSVSFILLVYGAIETMMSYFENRKKGTIMVAAGLAMLALGEFLSWYSFVFPESILYYTANIIKIIGLVALFIPVSKVPLTRIKIDNDITDLDMDKDAEDTPNSANISK